MVSAKVMGPTRKVAMHRDSQFSLSSIRIGVKALPDALGMYILSHLEQRMQ